MTLRRGFLVDHAGGGLDASGNYVILTEVLDKAPETKPPAFRLIGQEAKEVGISPFPTEENSCVSIISESLV